MSSPQRPSQPRGGRTKPTISDEDLARFNAALAATEQAKAKAVQREREQARAAKEAADAQRDHEHQLAAARRSLERAIADVRSATSGGQRQVAETAWRDAKARVLELESGERPRWAPVPPAAEPESADDGGAEPSSAEDDHGPEPTDHGTES